MNKQKGYIHVGLALLLLLVLGFFSISVNSLPKLNFSKNITSAQELSCAWNDVKSFVYQLSDYTNNNLNEIANTDYNMAIIDLARDGSTDYFTFEEIQNLKSTGKEVLAYFEIGAIENYRPEWNSVPADLKCGAVDGWSEEQYVKYWDERWWTVVKGRVDQAISAGFDGAYLDMIVTYEEIPLNCTDGMGTADREVLAGEMVELIARLSSYAKGIDPDFKVVPQNSPELYTWAYWNEVPNQQYLNAIDGIGMEEMFYLAHDKVCSYSWCQENIQNAKAIADQGKPVFATDYIRSGNFDLIADAYEKAASYGFIEFVSDQALSMARVNTGYEPIACTGTEPIDPDPIDPPIDPEPEPQPEPDPDPIDPPIDPEPEPEPEPEPQPEPTNEPPVIDISVSDTITLRTGKKQQVTAWAYDPENPDAEVTLKFLGPDFSREFRTNYNTVTVLLDVPSKRRINVNDTYELTFLSYDSQGALSSRTVTIRLEAFK